MVDDFVCESVESNVPAAAPQPLDSSSFRFLEFFAGSGALTQAMELAGVPVDPPNDLADGGVDFGKLHEVEALKSYVADLSASGVNLMIHVAPPCATFSRARDRSWRTRLRSSQRPQGLVGLGWWCKEANKVARHTLDFVEFCARDLGACVTMENPSTSYLWSFLQFDPKLPFDDVVFSPCKFGALCKKADEGKVLELAARRLERLVLHKGWCERLWPSTTSSP